MSDTPTPSQAAEKAEMPVLAYLRATKDGMPVWDGEDCVCQDPVYPSDPDGSDADCISMPVVRLSDAESQLAEMRAEALKFETRAELAEQAHVCAAEERDHLRSVNADLRAEVERLKAKARESDARLFEVRKLLNERPAMNASLAPAYVHWSGKVYALDWLNALDDAALAADGKDGAHG